MIKKPFQDPLLFTRIRTQACPVTHFLYLLPTIEINHDRMQEEGRLTTIIRLQIVFVGLLNPDYYKL